MELKDYKEYRDYVLSKGKDYYTGKKEVLFNLEIIKKEVENFEHYIKNNK